MESLIALASFVFVTSATPGPNNILLTTSGIRFGVWRTLPHILGIQLGIGLQLILCSLGVGLTLMEIPVVSLGIRILGTAYMGYLAWKLCCSSFTDNPEAVSDKPFSVLQAALFQFINPKAWIMSITAGALFLPRAESEITAIALLCGTMLLVGGPSSGSWAVIGSVIRHYLTDPVWRRAFISLMVCLTAYAALSLWTI